MNDVLMAVAGLVTPLLAATLRHPQWVARRNFVVSILTSAGLGSAATALSQPVTAVNVAHAIAAVFVLSQAIYHIVFRGSKLHIKLANVNVLGVLASLQTKVLGK